MQVGGKYTNEVLVRRSNRTIFFMGRYDLGATLTEFNIDDFVEACNRIGLNIFIEEEELTA